MSIGERLEMHERFVNERLMLAEMALAEAGAVRSDSARASVRTRNNLATPRVHTDACTSSIPCGWH